MILEGQRTILVVGILGIAFIGWLIMLSSPMPGGLSSVHERVEELSTTGSCEHCHSEGGLTMGCLSCHSDIQGQLAQQTGYHGFLLKGRDADCSRCHHEHSGPDFSLVNADTWGAQVPRAFKHPHVQFTLEGKHSLLICEDCHEQQKDGAFTLPGFVSTPRSQTFLGLAQDCRSCHADVHSNMLTPSCEKCHGQDAFKPPVLFDHSKHFALIGGHAGLACKGCHRLPEAPTSPLPLPFPFDKVRGKACEECHTKPHYASSIVRCEECHLAPEPHWVDAIQNVSADKHAQVGFRLLGAHSQVECAKCHPREIPFAERYRDVFEPGNLRTEDTCQGCHRDVHNGQFQRHFTQCLDCHDRDHFLPSTYGHATHAEHYPLTGAHAAVACIACHKVKDDANTRQFVSTSQVCKDCHAYPHGEQFRKEIADGDCTVCHSTLADAFQIRPFDHQFRTGYALLGAHARAVCNDCHVELPENSGVRVRKYRETPQECDACHRDVHRGQFQKDGRTACVVCHDSFDTWRAPTFDHDTMSRFKLEGVHAVVACARCHQPVKLPDGAEVVQYKPLGVQCKDCHEIVPDSTTKSVR